MIFSLSTCIWPESIDCRMGRLFEQASSVILADTSITGLEHLDSLEVCADPNITLNLALNVCVFCGP